MAVRGALIVLEGCDRAGKSTQCVKLVEALKKNNKPAQLIHFPDASSSLGKLLRDYLEKRIELEDHAVHLLFSANRWEFMPKMKKLLFSGTTLIVDRYAFSGVAFSAAKETLDLEWCKSPDRGLPEPDLVLYLDLPSSVAVERGGFGDERYELLPVQQRAQKVFENLRQESYWKVLMANKSVEEVHADILKEALKTVQDVQTNTKPISELWKS